MRHNNIVSAIEWLPEHLFTEEIVEAAVESKEIEVLSHIPGRFLTPGRIERIIAGSTESWHSFELRNIPEAYRSGAVCDYAMRKKPKNISNRMRPGLTTATQYSGLPLQEPIRVSAGLAVTGLSGKILIHT